MYTTAQMSQKKYAERKQQREEKTHTHTHT